MSIFVAVNIVKQEEQWFIIVISLCAILLVKAIADHVFKGKGGTHKQRTSSVLPHQGPLISPFRVPVLGGLMLVRKSLTEMESKFRSLRSDWSTKNSPLLPAITLRLTSSQPYIFVFCRSLAHKALVENGALFADRPGTVPTMDILSSSRHTVAHARYGDIWRTFKRNLTSQILHPSRTSSFARARSSALDILICRLTTKTTSSSSVGGAVRVVDHIRYAMFCILVRMCFGEDVSEDEIRSIESIQCKIQIYQIKLLKRVEPLNLKPTWLNKIILKGRWKEFLDTKKTQESIFIPLIRRREQQNIHSFSSYVDTLLDLQVPVDNIDGQNSENKRRKLTEKEMVSCCSEFFTAGTDTTTSALQWIMARLVMHPEIQSRLYEDIKGNISGQVVEEEDLSKMVYLKAIVLEGLRRHPPGHFVLPHAVTQDVELDGFRFPKNSIISFMVADMGWDAQVWDDPMEFMPERFLPYLESSGQFDLTCNKEIKMMPFGVGRRMCPASNLAILHLEYFLANLVWRFEWRAADGHIVDLSETQEFTTVMKYPLHAKIIPRVT